MSPAAKRCISHMMRVSDMIDVGMFAERRRADEGTP